MNRTDTIAAAATICALHALANGWSTTPLREGESLAQGDYRALRDALGGEASWADEEEFEAAFSAALEAAPGA